MDLIRRKRDVVVSTSELHSMLNNIEILDGDVLFRSDQYLQIGCDLRDLVHLQRSLSSAIEVENTSILFIAEVSIAYMPVQAADNLIAWGGRFSDARFCLLEQLLPNGIRHPFAATMMAHFNNIGTPLRPAEDYPTILDQKTRFKKLGWPNVVARNLWELWGAADFLTFTERRSLDFIEPFDEWEEFALFGCHYMLLVADASARKNKPFLLSKDIVSATPENSSYVSGSLEAEISYTENPKGRGFKRFASALPIQGQQLSHENFGSFGGMGLTTRVNSIDVYGKRDTVPTSSHDATSSFTPTSRMCHTTTDMGNAGTLLVGGRTSPDGVLADCWIYHKLVSVWERVSDLPNPQYRHQAVYLGDGYVLIAPGKVNSKVFSKDFVVWHRRIGWLLCVVKNNIPLPDNYGNVFSVNSLDSSRGNHAGLRTGILAGGISENGVILDSVWHWELSGLEQNVSSESLLQKWGWLGLTAKVRSIDALQTIQNVVTRKPLFCR